MPTLFKRSNGILYYIQTDDAGKRRWISTDQRTRQLANTFVLQRQNKQAFNIQGFRLESFIKEFISYASSIYSAETMGGLKKQRKK